MAEARLNVRVDAGIKDQAEIVFQKLGLTMSSGINIFLSKVAAEQRVPFSLTLKREYIIGEEDSRFEQAAALLLREELAEYKAAGKPVARYDEKNRRPYLEYPDGRKEYTIAED